MSLASIQKEISQLSFQERAMLIDLLWESLDETRVADIEAKWPSESEDRIDAYERGELPACRWSYCSSRSSFVKPDLFTRFIQL